MLSLGGLVSLVSFQYGSSSPDFSITESEREFCKNLALHPPKYADIYYKRGFPFELSGEDEINIYCNNVTEYIPPLQAILRSWQFYANGIMYMSLLGGATILIKGVVLHQRSE